MKILRIIISYAISLFNSKFLELTVKERLDVLVSWEYQYKTSTLTILPVRGAVYSLWIPLLLICLSQHFCSQFSCPPWVLVAPASCSGGHGFNSCQWLRFFLCPMHMLRSSIHLSHFSTELHNIYSLIREIVLNRIKSQWNPSEYSLHKKYSLHEMRVQGIIMVVF